MTVILMYHALYDGAPERTIDAEDLPYAVSRDVFAAQLDAIRRRMDADDDFAIRITFDDGHASNHEIALPLLLERELQATFFVTTGFIERRPHFCTASQLGELVAAGMTLGGHGHTHAFADDLEDAALRDEFEQCQAVLAPIVGKRVNSLSFPGGRYDALALASARAAGFIELHGSDPGLYQRDEAPAAVLPRVALRHGTDLATFERMISPDPGWYAAAARRQRAKQLVRRMLGNRLYHGLYKSLSAG